MFLCVRAVMIVGPSFSWLGFLVMVCVLEAESGWELGEGVQSTRQSSVLCEACLWIYQLPVADTDILVHFIYVFVYISIYIYIYIYMNLYICVCVYIYICMHPYIHVHVHAFIRCTSLHASSQPAAYTTKHRLIFTLLFVHWLTHIDSLDSLHFFVLPFMFSTLLFTGSFEHLRILTSVLMGAGG